MRPDTKLKLGRRKHVLELLKWLYARRNPQLDGTKISLEHRRSLKEHSRSLTYGEVDVPDFLSILDLVKPVQGEIFVDLGSGTGKAVLAASCGFPEFSKCRGIELVQGLADAAADHLETAKTFLATQAPSDGTALTKAAGGTPPGEGYTARVAGASLSNESLGKGGGGGCRGSRQAPCKVANRGLSAVDLEALIVDLVSRQSLPPPARGAGKAGGDGVAARVALEATAEEVASWLVQELGHRRYKNSLRGYGGLQKFLVSRRGASDASNGLEIAEDGATVTAASTETNPFPVDGNPSSRKDSSAAGDRGEAETTSGDVSVDKGCSHGRGGTAAGVVAATPAAAGNSGDCPSVVDDRGSSAEGTVHAPSACLPASTAALSLTSSLPHLSCEEPTVTDDDRPPVTGDRDRMESGGDRSKDSSGSKVFADRRRLPEPGPLTFESLSGVELVCGDIFREAWNDAGVVYVASLLFDDSMMVLLARRIQKLGKGARVISLRPIPNLETSGETRGQSSTLEDGSDGDRGAAERHRGLQLLHESVFRMSWQMARVYIYLRL